MRAIPVSHEEESHGNETDGPETADERSTVRQWPAACEVRCVDEKTEMEKYGVEGVTCSSGGSSHAPYQLSREEIQEILSGLTGKA
jgi:hypothetical protein